MDFSGFLAHCLGKFIAWQDDLTVTKMLHSLPPNLQRQVFRQWVASFHREVQTPEEAIELFGSEEIARRAIPGLFRDMVNGDDSADTSDTDDSE